MTRRVSDEVQDTFWFGWWVIAITMILLLAGLLYAYGWYSALPWFRNQETVITRSSHEYVTTKQVLLLKWAADVERLEAELAALGPDPQNAAVVDAKERQLSAILARLRAEAALIRPEQVPVAARPYLR